MLAHFACFSHNCICHFRQVLPQHLRTALNFSLRKKEVPLTARRTNAIPDRVHSRAIHCQVSALGKFLSDTRANFERTHTPQLRPDFAQSRCQSALEPLCSEYQCSAEELAVLARHLADLLSMHERFQRKEQAAGFVVRKSFIRQGMHPLSMADWPPNRSNGVLVPPEWKNIRHF